MESEIKELNNLEAKIIDLKSKIEIEINEINILYEKALDDVTKSFEMKHEILYKEENDIKEKLQNEITKVKEKLEYYLSKSVNEINIKEKINQGIKKLKNEKKIININKTLSYIIICFICNIFKIKNSIYLSFNNKHFYK